MVDRTEMGDNEIAIIDEGPVIRAAVQLGSCAPGRALSCFTDAAVLARWWGGELTAELVAGGEYSVWFPAISARLAGRVIRYAPGSGLEFSWGWEHEPASPGRTVSVAVSTDDSGTKLTIAHGPHGTGEAEAAARAEHRAGWEYFLPRLPAAVAG